MSETKEHTDYLADLIEPAKPNASKYKKNIKIHEPSKDNKESTNIANMELVPNGGEQTIFLTRIIDAVKNIDGFKLTIEISELYSKEDTVKKFLRQRIPARYSIDFGLIETDPGITTASMVVPNNDNKDWMEKLKNELDEKLPDYEWIVRHFPKYEKIETDYYHGSEDPVHLALKELHLNGNYSSIIVQTRFVYTEAYNKAIANGDLVDKHEKGWFKRRCGDLVEAPIRELEYKYSPDFVENKLYPTPDRRLSVNKLPIVNVPYSELLIKVPTKTVSSVEEAKVLPKFKEDDWLPIRYWYLHNDIRRAMSRLNSMNFMIKYTITAKEGVIIRASGSRDMPCG